MEEMVSSLSSKVLAEKYLSGSYIHLPSVEKSYTNPVPRSRSSCNPSIRPFYHSRPRDWFDLATEAVDDISADNRIFALPCSCIADIHSIWYVPFVRLFPRILLTSHCSTKRAVPPRRSDSTPFPRALCSRADSFSLVVSFSSRSTS